MLISFLCQTDKFISTGVMPSQKFWQWGDDINTKDDITPFDGTPYILWWQKLWWKLILLVSISQNMSFLRYLVIVSGAEAKRNIFGSTTLSHTLCATITHFIRCRFCSIFRNPFVRSSRCEPDEHGLRPNYRGGRRHPGRGYRQVPHGQEEGIRATHHQPRYALRTLFVWANIIKNIISVVNRLYLIDT